MYYVLYVEGCSPRTQIFTTKKEVKVFLNSFIKKYGSLDDQGDNWVDYIFKGKKLDIDLVLKLK